MRQRMFDENKKRLLATVSKFACVLTVASHEGLLVCLAVLASWRHPAGLSVRVVGICAIIATRTLRGRWGTFDPRCRTHAQIQGHTTAVYFHSVGFQHFVNTLYTYS